MNSFWLEASFHGAALIASMTVGVLSVGLYIFRTTANTPVKDFDPHKLMKKLDWIMWPASVLSYGVIQWCVKVSWSSIGIMTAFVLGVLAWLLWTMPGERDGK